MPLVVRKKNFLDTNSFGKKINNIKTHSYQL